MATSQFYSVCLAHERIRACRAFLLASPCRLSRSLLQKKAMSISQLSFHGSFGYGFNGATGPFFACRALSSIGSSSRSRKAAPVSQNPREEIRQLDEEIRKLEKERSSVGKVKKTGFFDVGGKKGNARYGNDAVSKGKHVQSPPVGRNAKFSASAGSSRIANARALARYEQEEEEEDDDDFEADDDNEDDDVLDEDVEELVEDSSSDAEMYMETSEDEEPPKVETSTSASLTSKEPSSDSTETPEVSQAEIGDHTVEASAVQDAINEGVHSIKHPWKEWNDFYDVLAQKNYFKDVPPIPSAMEGEGHLRFQSSAHMKRAILEFSRDRDDIIRFLTKKHIKSVVTVGCPSTDRKIVNACKRLRVLCEIPEDEVCQQCKLKTFCTRAFAAPSPDLMAETVDVARVLYSFALNASPIAESQVSYPVGVVKSACHLFDEIVQLSAYPKDPGLPALKSRLPVKQPVNEKHDTDSNHRPGDWTCPDCNFLNFSKNQECRECGTRKEGRKPLEPGDWECPECTFVNFRRNNKCRECLTARPAGAGGGGNETLMPGDWKCPECQFVNFRRNSECHKCSTRCPKGTNVYGEEDLEPGDWKCPECNFRNFKRNKNCKECGSPSPDQGKKDDRWGLKKSSEGGWGSSRSLPPMSADTGASSGRAKYQEWKPDLSRKASDDSDEDLEENADVVFGLDGDKDDEHLPRSSQALEKRTKSKGHASQRQAADELSLSDFDFSDLDDLPKESSKKSGGRSKNGNVMGRDKKEEDAEDDDNDDDDDDNDMEKELSEDDKSMDRRGFSGRWDDSASDADEDGVPRSRAASKHKPAKGRGMAKTFDDSDDDEDGFSDDDGDDDFRGGKGRSFSPRGGRNGSNFGSRGGQRGARFGNSRGGWRGESSGRGAFGGRGSRFSESDDDGVFRRESSRGSFRGSNGRGAFGGRGSKFSESDDDGVFRRESSRGSFRGNGRGRGGGGTFRGNGRGRGGGGSSRGGGRGFRGRGGGGRGGRGRS